MSVTSKLRYSLELLADAAMTQREGFDFAWLWDDLQEYDDLLAQYGSRQLRTAKVVEVGFGARPERLLAMQSMGVDARGIDAEMPMLDGGLSEVRTIARQNGWERASKSLIRFSLFDRSRRKALTKAVRERGLDPMLDRERLHVTDAADFRAEQGSIDLVTSEDVFEHIHPDSIARLIPAIASWLDPQGLALIRPNIFTGITGGHLLEWNRRSLRTPPRRRRSQPWDHLRAREFSANTYLNEFTRAQYREMFSEHFQILEERVKLPDLGREYLSEDAQSELNGFPDEELFSNQVLFVMRPHPRT